MIFTAFLRNTYTVNNPLSLKLGKILGSLPSETNLLAKVKSALISIESTKILYFGDLKKSYVILILILFVMNYSI